jgi:hypothetical protein
MKNLFCTLFIAFASLAAYAQAPATTTPAFPLDPETKKVTYTEVIAEEGITQQELYKRAWTWLQKHFPENKMIKADETDFKVSKNGFVSALTTYDYKYKSTNIVSFTILIEAKEGRYKYTFDKFSSLDKKIGEQSLKPLELNLSKMSTSNRKELTVGATTEIDKLLEELKKYMHDGIEPKKIDNW